MEPTEEVLKVIVGFTILVGALQCFFGYRIFKFILGLTGFLIGGVLASTIGYSISQDEITALFSGILGGVIGAALMFALYYVGVFIIGALLGGVLGTILFTLAESSPEPAFLLILAVIAGVMALIFQKFMIIISTGFSGSWCVVIGIAYLTTNIIDFNHMEQAFMSDGSLYYGILLSWLALGLFGVIVQYGYAQKNESNIKSIKKIEY